MESSLLTAVFLPIALSTIMFGMGLSLTLNHFRHLFIEPKAILSGLVLQIILLPILAWLIAVALDLKPEFAIGLMLIAACPGGPTSNLISHLSRGDSALSITLTAFSSLITIATIPLVVNASYHYFLGAGQQVTLPIPQTILQIIIVTLIPVTIGMVLKARLPALAERAERPVKILSAVFLILVIVGAMIREKDNLIRFFVDVGSATLALNLGGMLLGFVLARALKLASTQARTIMIEVGIQNGTLGIAIAAAPSLLNNPTIAIPAVVYSLFMFLSGSVLIAWGSLKKD